MKPNSGFKQTLVNFLCLKCTLIGMPMMIKLAYEYEYMELQPLLLCY